ncbi:hypothetical protein QL285_092514 [Trifolium repens]|nr:hypothetical protein QL285_092514 [Trifolium repens]
MNVGTVVRCGGGGGDEVVVDVACLVFFDSRFSDHFSNLLRFAGLYVSGLTFSASASTVLSSRGVCFFGVYFATTSFMVVPLSLPRPFCLGSLSTFVWSAVRLMELVLYSDGPSAFASSSEVSV